MNYQNLSTEQLKILKKQLQSEIEIFSIKEKSAKIFLNSGFGALGNPYFRWYDTRIAEAITVTGQYCIRWIQNNLNAYLNKLAKTTGKDYVIMSDTDSVALNLNFAVQMYYKGDKTNKTAIINFLDKLCKEVISPYIKKKCEELSDYLNAYANSLDFKREVIADRGLWTAKKRYCLNVYDSEGVRYEKPKLKIMGIEVQRSSTPKICRDKLKESIRIILTKDQPTLVSYINDFKKEFYNSKVDEISFPRSVNKLEEYSDPDTINKKSTPIAVKGALFHNHLIKKYKLGKKYQLIGNSEKIKFLYLTEPNLMGSRVISYSGSHPPKEFKVEKYIDYDTQFEKSFLDPLYSILDAIHWKHEEENTLERFFGI